MKPKTSETAPAPPEAGDELARTRRQLEATRDLFEQVVEAMSEAFFLVDVSGTVARTNGAAAAMLALDAGSIVGRKLADVCPELPVPPTPRELLARADDGHLVDVDAELRRGAGEPIHLSVSASLVRDQRGGVTGTLIVARDITERHRSADELARSNHELEIFAYVASHDLQEPLRMISSYLQLVERKYGDALDETGKEFIFFAVDGAKRMQRLILDLLAYSRVGTKPLALEELDSGAVVDRALGNLKVAIEESGARIERGRLPPVLGDEGQLVQLFQNLIGNALKFKREGAPAVHVGATADGRGTWRFEVRDDGIGLEPRFSERIFQIFQRLHTRDEYPGTGLGLAICKKSVERHGGRIWVESEPGKGSTFSFTLQGAADPVAARPVEEGSASPPSTDGGE